MKSGRGVPPLVWILVVIGLFILAVSLFMNLVLMGAVVFDGLGGPGSNFVEKRIQGEDRDKVLVIDVNGLISSGGTVMFFPSSDMVDHVKQRLAIAKKNDRIKAVILRVDSPGGTVTASEEIYKAINEFRKESGKPVISLMGSVAASGGYYISMACDRVLAQRATITGSIGVIMQFLNYEGLFNKYGLKYETITPENADLKGIGAGDREMTEAERKVLQDMVEEMYDLFIEKVKAGRPGLDETKILELADGRPYTGAQAAENGLVDLLGDLDAAIDEARKIKGFGENPTVVQYRIVTPFSALFGTSAKASSAPSVEDIARAVQNGTTPRLYYLYTR